MIKLEFFQKEYCDEYIKMYNEFVNNNSDLVPDILEIKCTNNQEYQNLLNIIKSKEAGIHDDTDWYKEGYYFLAFDKTKLIGLGCIRNELTKKGYDIWGNIAYGVRPSERKKGYGTLIANELVQKSKELGITEIILCHYEDNKISPKIFKKIGAEFINEIISPYTNKKIKRYNIVVNQ